MSHHTRFWARCCIFARRVRLLTMLAGALAAFLAGLAAIVEQIRRLLTLLG